MVQIFNVIRNCLYYIFRVFFFSFFPNSGYFIKKPTSKPHATRILNYLQNFLYLFPRDYRFVVLKRQILQYLYQNVIRWKLRKKKNICLILFVSQPPCWVVSLFHRFLCREKIAMSITYCCT